MSTTALTFNCYDCRQELTVAASRTKPLRCPHCYAKNDLPGRPTTPRRSRERAASAGEGPGGAHYLKAIGSIGVGLCLVGFAVFAFLDSGGRVIAYGPAAVGVGAILIGGVSAVSGLSLTQINNLGGE